MKINSFNKKVECPKCHSSFVIFIELKEILNIKCPLCKYFFSLALIDGSLQPMPQFAWKENVPPVPKELFDYIIDNTKKDDVILELGSGTTTELFAKQRTTYSIEHHHELIGMHNESKYYIYAKPINEWYDLNALKNLPHYDILLVDGTDNDNRIDKFVEHIDIFNNNVPWVIDDIDYEPFKKGMENLLKISNKKFIIHENTIRRWGVFI